MTRRDVGLLATCALSLFACDRGELVLLPPHGAVALSPSTADAASSSGGAQGFDGALSPNRGDGGAGPDAGRPFPFGGMTQFECNSSQQCGGRHKFCDQRSHRCVECVQPFDCARPAVCDTFTERCVLPCQTRDDCAATAQTRCDPNRHVCVGCLTDQECVDPAPHCDSSTGQCVECVSDVHCSAPWRFCFTPRNECVECLNDQQCAPGTTCAQGRCR